MNTSKIIAAAALSLLAAVGAHAESYQGVQALTNGATRADVAAEAAATVRAGNVYGDLGSSKPAIVNSTRDRASVQAEAVATAHEPNQNLDRRAFVNSTVPPQYTGMPRSETRRAGL